MNKVLRKSVYRGKLESQLAKYERRIQKMAENAYKIRQVLESMYMEEQRAIHQPGIEASVGAGSTDAGTGGSDVSDTATIETVLGEQPAQLPSDSGDLGVVAGSAV